MRVSGLITAGGAVQCRLGGVMRASRPVLVGAVKGASRPAPAHGGEEEPAG